MPVRERVETMNDFPLNATEIATLCAAARQGLAARSSSADPDVMATAWAAMDRLGKWSAEREKARDETEHIEKSAP